MRGRVESEATTQTVWRAASWSTATDREPTVQDSRPPPADIETLLRNLLQTGALRALPTNPHVRNTLLAVATGGLARQRPYAEREVNEVLSAWLESVRATIDHVTLRRRMVDLGFLKRTRDGSRYYLNFGRVAAILGDGTVEIDAGAITDDIVRGREARKKAYRPRP